jgi:hypothetical protein
MVLTYDVCPCILCRQIKVTEEEDEEDVDARRAVSVVVQYGACGLAACGQSPTWRGVANVLRLLYAYYFWNWYVDRRLREPH